MPPTQPIHAETFALWQIVVLAVVQGVTEFLPISSDGHLVVVAPLLFGSKSTPPEMMDVTIVLHLGTLGSILVYYRRRIARLLGEDRNVVWLLAIGTVPAVVLVLTGELLFESWFKPMLQNTLLGGFMLPVSGLALLWAVWQKPGTREYRDLTWRDSLIIGIFQATAILPGLSRSGTTISSGLTLGLTRQAAATYSFLLAIPAIGGAGLYEAFSMVRHQKPLTTPVTSLAIGAAISFAVGIVALWSLERLLARGQLHWLAWYCIALGVIVVAWQLSGA